MVPALKGKARAFEGLRQRCLSLTCSLRSSEDKQKAEALRASAMAGCVADEARIPRSEINVDDDEIMPDDDEAMEEVEDEAIDMDIDMFDGKRDYIVDLFTFSRGLAFYEPILVQLLSASTAHVCAVITSTAHPSASVMARRLGLEVFVALPASTDHSISHGVQIQESIFKHLFLQQKGLSSLKHLSGQCCF